MGILNSKIGLWNLALSLSSFSFSLQGIGNLPVLPSQFHKFYIITVKSWGSSVSIVSEYRRDDWRLISGTGKGFFL
jgi:hypothetical protein